MGVLLFLSINIFTSTGPIKKWFGGTYKGPVKVYNCYGYRSRGESMKKQIDYYKEAPDAFKAMFEMEKFIKEIPLDSKLKELVKIRTSQINGCAYCVNEHSKEALEMGETIQRVISLVVWKECTFYSRQEQAALNLVEHIVEVADKRIPDDVYQEISKYFTDQEYVYLVFCINQMNAWNRIAISMGKHADSMEL